MTLPCENLNDALDRAERHAPFLRRLIARQGDVVACLLADGPDAALAAGIAAAAGLPPALRLRRERGVVALVVALADLAGSWGLETVTGQLSDFADRAFDAALTAAVEERTPGEPLRGFAVLALGKHGSRELNYSSDIDPILLFDPATLPRRAREDPAEAAVRLARRALELLQDRNDGGQVFRVDLRLRPSPEATPIAIPIHAAIAYYESIALPWERAAFIRARAAAGDIALGQHFLDAIRPFIWRRALDYGAIAEIRDHLAADPRSSFPGPALRPGL